MKRYIFLIPALWSIFALPGCDRREIPVFGEERHIHFSSDTTVKAVVSFAVMPGVTEYTLGIPVTMIGRVQEQDLPYSVRVVTDGPNATTLPQQAYELPASPVFRSHRYEDTLYVKLHRLPELGGKEFRLRLEVATNDHYTADFPLHMHKEITVGDKLVQPSWWTTTGTGNITSSYLGAYSDIKLLSFIEATGVNDLTGMDNLLVGTYVRIFVYWLREKDKAGETVYEADGTTKVLSTITYANV